MAERVPLLIALLEAAMGGYLLYAVACFIALSLHWPLVGDATLLHYCVLLMRHGFAPYRQLVDVNLPGTYFVEWAITGMFGYGALAWRIFDLLLLAALAATAPVLARPELAAGAEPASPRVRLDRWFAPVWAVGLFALIHGRDGITELGQRDLLMTVMLAVACILLFRARVGTGRPMLLRMGGFGAAIGAAATVKPLALAVLPALLGCLFISLRRRERSVWAAMTAAMTGAALPLTACLLWLVHMQALGAFFTVMRDLVPLHSSLFRLTPLHLLGGTVSSVLLPLFLLGLPPVLAARPWRSFEGAVLVLALVFGAVSFWVQGRGYPYHRYPSEWFLLVLWARVLTQTVRGGKPLLRACAVLALIYGGFVLGPRSLAAVQSFTPKLDPQGQALEAVLARDGGPALSGHVQCLDMAGGCITTLLRMRLVQSTGYLYDCYALAPVDPGFVDEQRRYRRGWMRALTVKPPEVIIAFSDECGPRDWRYAVLGRWPALDDLLRDSYVLEEQWTPHRTVRWNDGNALQFGFRVYRRVD